MSSMPRAMSPSESGCIDCKSFCIKMPLPHNGVGSIPPRRASGRWPLSSADWPSTGRIVRAFRAPASGDRPRLDKTTIRPARPPHRLSGPTVPPAPRRTVPTARASGHNRVADWRPAATVCAPARHFSSLSQLSSGSFPGRGGCEQSVTSPATLLSAKASVDVTQSSSSPPDGDVGSLLQRAIALVRAASSAFVVFSHWKTCDLTSVAGGPSTWMASSPILCPVLRAAL